MSSSLSKTWEIINSLDEPKLVLAPMAEVNDLAFRILVRKYGIKLCYTGMINANQWIQGHKYQRRIFGTSDIDHPVVGQLAGSEHEPIMQSAADLADFCDIIDLNLGCSQGIAKRGGYGYFMVDTPEKRESVLKLFKRLVETLSVPVSAKMRIFRNEDGEPDGDLTVNFAKRLVECGVSMLQVHGRSEQRNKKASVYTDIIKRVVEAVPVPVIANGGVWSLEDAEDMRLVTGAAAVSVGQAVLKNPTLFNKDGPVSRKEFALQYLEIAKEHPVPLFAVRKHMFNFYESVIKQNPGIESKISNAQSPDDLVAFVNDIENIN